MDILDKISALIIILLALSLGALGMDYQREAGNAAEHTTGKYSSSINTNRIPSEMIRQINDLMAVNNIEKADAIITALLERYSYEGEAHMLKGDIMMRRQDPAASIDSYRNAVELDPDYVDKKAPSFQGRKIRIAVNEAKAIADTTLSNDPDNKDMKRARKNIYYLLRSLAGSCG